MIVSHEDDLRELFFMIEHFEQSDSPGGPGKLPQGPGSRELMRLEEGEAVERFLAEYQLLPK